MPISPTQEKSADHAHTEPHPSLEEVAGAGIQVTLATAESYNRITNAWSTLPPMPTRSSAAAAVTATCPPGQTGTCVYAVGGESNNMLLNMAEVYTPANNTWSTWAAMPTRRGYLSGAAAACPRGQAGTCVYAVGGFGGGVLGVVESYNPATNAWSPAASMPTARSTAATTATTCPPGQGGICLYTVGGQGIVNGPSLGSVQSDNPVSNLWTELPPLPTPAPASLRRPWPVPSGWPAIASTHPAVRRASATAPGPRWKPSTLRTRRRSEPAARSTRQAPLPQALRIALALCTTSMPSVSGRPRPRRTTSGLRSVCLPG